MNFSKALTIFMYDAILCLCPLCLLQQPLHLFIVYSVCVSVVSTCYSKCVELRAQLVDCFSLSAIGFQGLNSGCQAWWQCLYPLSSLANPGCLLQMWTLHFGHWLEKCNELIIENLSRWIGCLPRIGSSDFHCFKVLKQKSGSAVNMEKKNHIYTFLFKGWASSQW